MSSLEDLDYLVTQEHGAPIVFTLTKDSVWNTIISSQDIIFEVASPGILHPVTTINRIDKATDEKRFVAQIAWKAGNRSVVRIGPGAVEWVRIWEWLTKEKPGLTTAKTFMDGFGVKYRWKTRRGRLHLTVDGEPENPEESHPTLACFHTCRRRITLSESRSAYLEVSPKVLPSIDHVVVSWLLMEKRRRDS